jgi:hypothetical protein
MHPQASALARLRPKLFHITSPGAYRSIFDHGLMSTALLLETYGWKPEAIDELVTTPRSDYVTIEGIDGRDPARLIHQRPINPAVLGKSLALTGTTESDYLRLLANRVFLFPSDDTATGFREALLADGPVDVLTINTFTMLKTAEDRVEVSRHNSGASPRSPIAKGRQTWLPLDQFERRVAEIKEVTVVDRLDDVETFTLSVVRVDQDGTRHRVWPEVRPSAGVFTA